VESGKSGEWEEWRVEWGVGRVGRGLGEDHTI